MRLAWPRRFMHRSTKVSMSYKLLLLSLLLLLLSYMYIYMYIYNIYKYIGVDGKSSPYAGPSAGTEVVRLRKWHAWCRLTEVKRSEHHIRGRRAASAAGLHDQGSRRASVPAAISRIFQGAKCCTPEINTSEIIMDFQWHFPIDLQWHFPMAFHFSVVLSKGLSLVQRISSGILQRTSSSILQHTVGGKYSA